MISMDGAAVESKLVCGEFESGRLTETTETVFTAVESAGKRRKESGRELYGRAMTISNFRLAGIQVRIISTLLQTIFESGVGRKKRKSRAEICQSLRFFCRLASYAFVRFMVALIVSPRRVYRNDARAKS